MSTFYPMQTQPTPLTVMGLKQLNWWSLSRGCQEKVEPLMTFDTWGFCTSLQTLLHVPHYTVPSAPKRYWLEAWESILQGSGLHEGNNSGKDTKLHLNLSALSLLKKKTLIYIFKRATSENLLQPQLGSRDRYLCCVQNNSYCSSWSPEKALPSRPKDTVPA